MNASKPLIRTNSRTQNSAGFTLMEVLMAILILSVCIPAIMQAYNVAADMAGLSRQRAEALAVGQSALDELIATGEWQTGTPSGEEKPGPTLFKWDTSLTQWDEPNTQQLTVKVTWTHTGQPQEIALDTVVYTPDDTGVVGSTSTPTGGLGIGRVP